jgi:UrcA family protein
MTRILTAAALLLASAAAAVGQPPAEKPHSGVVVVAEDTMPTRHVSFADLDLSTPGGEQTLVRRVKLAVSKVCDEAVGPLPIIYAKQECWKSTWTESQPKLNAALERSRQIAATGSPTTAATITIVAAR